MTQGALPMKFIASKFLSAYFILACIGCTTSPFMKISPIKSESQEMIYANGKETLISKKSNSIVIAPYEMLNKPKTETYFSILIQNSGKTSINLTSENIKVTLKEKKRDGTISTTKIPILSYTDLLLEINKKEEKLKNAATWSAAIGAVGASFSGYSTSTTYHSGNTYGSYSSNSYGNYGYRPFSTSNYGTYSGSYGGTSTTTTYDSAKAQYLSNQNSEKFTSQLEAIHADAQNNRQFVEQNILKDQTIFPNQSYSGLLAIDTRSLSHTIESDIEISISIENESHIFTFSRAVFK
jgi:hypothetical protein